MINVTQVIEILEGLYNFVTAFFSILNILSLMCLPFTAEPSARLSFSLAMCEHSSTFDYLTVNEGPRTGLRIWGEVLSRVKLREHYFWRLTFCSFI